MADNVYQLLHNARLRLRHTDLCPFPDTACNCGLDELKERIDERLAEPEVCPTCDGDREVSHGSCGVPDCEHAEDCPTCGGSGKLPTPDEIAELREECSRLAGDLMVAEAELAAFKERDAERPHPFDEQARAACTGLTADWCPACGDCTCPGKHDENRDLNDRACPLHAPDSKHAEGPEPSQETFDQAWARMEALGYRFGAEALEQVRLGFELARGSGTTAAASTCCRNFDAWGCSTDQDGHAVDPRSCRVCGGYRRDHREAPP